MNKKIVSPKDAAAVILVRDGKVLWAQRNPQIKFLGGWHAFPGGKAETSDGEIAVRNCADQDLGKFIVSAVRECFEEAGVLLVRNGEKMTKGQRASLHDDLISGRSSFAEILEHWNLWIDAEDFQYTGFWTTPQFSPVRFKTRFFLVECPPKQSPYAAISEMRDVEFTDPQNALARWARAEVLISPPVLITLQMLAEVEGRRSKVEGPGGVFQELKDVAEKLLERSVKADGQIDFVEFNPHLYVFPQKTETLPPATHTNCFIVGKQEFVVIDAASKDPEEQEKLLALIDGLIEKGAVCREIVVSHLHPDHFGGEMILQKRLREKYGMEAPVSAHRLTAESLAGKVEFQKYVEDKEIFKLKNAGGDVFELIALHTPGHARGHLCFYDAAQGFLLSSDNVINLGSVVIAPPEGNLVDYLDSLEKMKNLPGLRFLCGSHGTAVYDAHGKITEFIEHRLMRERQIIDALETGAKTESEIVSQVYTELDPQLLKLAEKSVEAHLEKLAAEGRL